jgi:SEC-C motif
MPHPIEPCPCGSLKLYKDCCGRKRTTSSTSTPVPAHCGLFPGGLFPGGLFPVSFSAPAAVYLALQI